MKQSLKNRALKYLRNNQGWINGGELERLALEHGYKASNVSRRLRELCEDGLIERKIDKTENGKVASVWYKATPPKEIKTYYSQGELVLEQKIW